MATSSKKREAGRDAQAREHADRYVYAPAIYNSWDGYLQWYT